MDSAQESKDIRTHARFLDKVSPEPNTGCWLWTGACVGNYAVLKVRPRQMYAHRWIWEQERGPIPVGMQIDHMCNVPFCVNVNHMRVVTPRENTFALHSQAAARMRSLKTHCPHGHEYTPENIIFRVNVNHRGCLTCSRIQDRIRKRKYARARAIQKAITFSR